MNPIFKKLAKEAGLDDPACPLDVWDNPELEKFAELIIAEVVNHALIRTIERDRVLDHFGMR